MVFRWTRTDAAISVLDGFLGLLIGIASLGYVSASSPRAGGRRSEVLSFWYEFDMGVFGIPMFVGTLVLAPFLLRVLHGWSDLVSLHYYIRSAVAGIVFGLSAAVMTGFSLGLIVPFLPGEPGVESVWSERLLLLAAAPIYMGLSAGFIAVLMYKQLTLAGIGFGLLNGWLVKRTSGS